VLAGITGAGLAEVLDAFERVGRDRDDRGVLANRRGLVDLLDDAAAECPG
jgi:hypothetical protein